MTIGHSNFMIRSSRAACSMLAVVAGALTTFARSATGQGEIRTLRGFAYDSVRGAPLTGALVTIAGTVRSAFTDERGRFRFDSIAPGMYRLEVQHDVLDSMGLGGISRAVHITDGREEIQLAVPSFGSLWRAVCGSEPPKDSGFVFGTIRDASAHSAVAEASVDLTWLELRVDKDQGVRQSRWHAEARADAKGTYAICGVPADMNLRMQAATDSAASGLIDLPPLGLRVQRRDFLIARADSASRQRGTIAGFVTDSVGRPVSNARVVSDEVPEARSDSGGRFAIRGIPAGTRQIDVMAIGMVASSLAVDVTPGDTANVSIALQRINRLEAVRITASAAKRQALRGIEERRRNGFGRIIDSTVIGAMGHITAAFYSMPSVEVIRGRLSTQFWISLPAPRGERCVANLYIDGVRQHGFIDDPASGFDYLAALHTDEIAAIEVYPRAFTMPTEFMAGPACGAVVVWTKYYMR